MFLGGDYHMKKLLLLLIFLSFKSYPADWKYIKGGFIVDTSSIQKLPNGNFKVWFKNILDPDVLADMLNEHKKIGYYKDYSKYFYSLTLYEINCSQRLLQVRSGIDYNFDLNIIDSFNITVDNFTPIPPGTAGEMNMKFVCKK